MKKILISISIFFTLILLAAFILFHQATKDEIELTEEIQSKQIGKTVKLSAGKIYYELSGPENGNVIALVHGFSTPQFIFYKNIKALTNAGYRVLTFDHFGRGFSDHPKVVYDKDLFDTELLELLEKLKFSKPIYLIGYSLGGAVATVFTSRHPEWVEKLILIAPAGFVPEFSGRNRLALVPYLGEWLMAVIGKKSLLTGFQEDERKGLVSKEIINKYTVQLNFKNYRYALLSTMRNYPLQNLTEEYKILGKHNIPVNLIWGKLDSTVPFTGAEKIQTLIPKSKLIALEGVEHSIVYSNPEEVNQSILDFLK